MDRTVYWLNYVWPREYNPHFDYYDDEQMTEFFERPENAAEFTVWRDYHYFNAYDKCDFCCLLNRYCGREHNPHSDEPCAACREYNHVCRNTSAREASVPRFIDYPPQTPQYPDSTSSEESPGNEDDIERREPRSPFVLPSPSQIINLVSPDPGVEDLFGDAQIEPVANVDRDMENIFAGLGENVGGDSYFQPVNQVSPNPNPGAAAGQSPADMSSLFGSPVGPAPNAATLAGMESLFGTPGGPVSNVATPAGMESLFGSPGGPVSNAATLAGMENLFGGSDRRVSTVATPAGNLGGSPANMLSPGAPVAGMGGSPANILSPAAPSPFAQNPFASFPGGQPGPPNNPSPGPALDLIPEGSPFADPSGFLGVPQAGAEEESLFVQDPVDFSELLAQQGVGGGDIFGGGMPIDFSVDFSQPLEGFFANPGDPYAENQQAGAAEQSQVYGFSPVLSPAGAEQVVYDLTSDDDAEGQSRDKGKGKAVQVSQQSPETGGQSPAQGAGMSQPAGQSGAGDMDDIYDNPILDDMYDNPVQGSAKGTPGQSGAGDIDDLFGSPMDALAGGSQGQSAEALDPRCANCIAKGLQNCDIVVGTDEVVGFGCTNCRKMDKECQFCNPDNYTMTMHPRPDGFLEPLCCDQCLQPPGGIHTCSWRKVDIKGPPQPCEACTANNRPCTYTGAPAADVNDRYSHFSITQHFLNPRHPHLIEQVHNVSPFAPHQHHPSRRMHHRLEEVQVARKGWDASCLRMVPGLPLPLANTKRTYCHLCNYVNIKMRRQCNFERGVRACDTCNIWSLLCLVDGEIQPPDAIQKPRRKMWGECDPCRLNGTNCDRQRPCDSCVYVRHQPADCKGGKNEGTFPRGAGIGVQLYPYLASMKGGLRGVNDPIKVPPLHRMPENFHLEYNNWLAGGDLPVPPGWFPPPLEEQPPRPVPQPHMLPRIPEQGEEGGRAVPLVRPRRPRQQRQDQAPPGVIQPPPPPEAGSDLLNEGEEPYTPEQRALVQQYRNVWVVANVLIRCGQAVLNRAAVRVDLRNDLHSNVPVNLSQTARLVRTAIDNRLNWAELRPSSVIPLEVPPSLDNLMGGLTLGANVIFNVQDSGAEALPPLVGPLTAPYAGWVQINNVGDPNVAPGHPERSNPEALNANNAGHPNEASKPVMTAIPHFAAAVPPSATQLCFERKDTGFCLVEAEGCCDDFRHRGSPLGVCDQCNNDSRTRFELHMIANRMALRAYACSECVDRAYDVTQWVNRRYRIWVYPGDLSTPGIYGSTTQGVPLAITGCDCAAKLLSRRICTPHRLQHYAQMLDMAQKMKQYVMETWGRMVCPFCVNKVGTDSYNFQGPGGRGDQSQMFICLACLGVVIADPQQHAMTLQ